MKLLFINFKPAFMKQKLTYFKLFPNLVKNIFLTIAAFFVLQGFVFGQNVLVSGKVKANDGSVMIGANVYLKGTNVGTITDHNGDYSISSPKDGTLVFSILGFESVEVAVENRKFINITMQESSINLNEVVVVGYGAQQKKDLTGSVAVVSSKDLKNRPNTEFGYSLIGKAAGVQVIRSSGQPQAGFSIRVRGTSSITSGSDPLYIVDGVQTYNTNDINPADIESFTILKDASSAAIYGSAGANGVVLITTKRGHPEKLKIDFSTAMTISQAWKNIDMLDGSQFKDLAIEMGETADAAFWNKYNENTNWQKEIFRNALSQNYQLSATGGTKKLNYYLSGSWVDQNGIVLNNSLKRGTLKTNIDYKLLNFLKIGTSLAYDKWNDISVSENNRNGVITRLFTSIPNIGIWDKDDPTMYARSPFINDLENPYSTVYQPELGYDNSRLHGNVYGELNILKDLKFKSLYGFESSKGIFKSFQNGIQTRYGKSLKGIAQENSYDYKYWTSENTLNYTKIADKHNLNLLGGFILSREKTDNLYKSAQDFSGANNSQSVDDGAVKSIPVPYFVQKSHASFIGRLNYVFADKYFVTSNFRADGSGQFPEKNRWGYFPSFSTGWRISNEEFLKGNELISDLKVRAGWGIVGNDRAAPYAWYGIVDTVSNKYLIGGVLHSAYIPSSLENSDLRWEKTSQYDIGLDLAFFKNRLALTLDYYYKKTSDLLLMVPQPTSTGFPSALQNAGSLENKGFEIQVTSKNITSSKLVWTTDFNLSFNKNKVLDIVGNTIHTGGINPAGDAFNTALVEEGLPLGSFFGKFSQGVDPATGDINFLKTADGSADSIGIIGNANPDFVYGFTSALTYGNFSFDVFIQGVQGNQIFNATRILSESMALTMNQSATVLDRWKKSGDITDMPRSTHESWANATPSTRFVENGSYLRIKSLTLGYNFKGSLLNRLKISSCMLYLTCENLLTFTKYTGFDPEVSAFNSNNESTTNQNTALGVDYGTYPQSRDYMVGLKISF